MASLLGQWARPSGLTTSTLTHPQVFHKWEFEQMATVPTSRMETELRKLFLRWSAGLPNQTGRMDQYLDKFRRDSISLINKMGGDISRLGVSADFPAPKELDLDLVAGHVYDQMQLTVVRAQIMTGLNARESARALLKAGVDKEYYKLERLARTETVRAYWKNQWDEAEDLGLVMLWGAERGSRTCEWCLERDGMVVPSRLVLDHPNGRCTLVPTLPSRVEYQGSVADDGSIFYDPDWDAEFKPVASLKLPEEQEVIESLVYSDEEIARGLRSAEQERKSLETSSLYDNKGNFLGSQEELAAWNSYTSGGYVDINRSYRDPAAFAKEFEGDEFWMDMFLKQASDMENLVSKSVLNTDVTVVRGLTDTPEFDPTSLRVGQSFADPAFWSSSTKLEEAVQFSEGKIGASSQGGQGWLFVSKAPEGTHALPGVASQGELIFKPGQMQKIVGMDFDNHIVYLEMVP